MNWILQLDGACLLWIQEYIRNEILTPIVQEITNLGNAGFCWILLTIILLLIPKTRQVGILCASSLILSFLINNICLKNWIGRTRPYEVIEGLKLITKVPHDYSFPSGHAASSFSCAVVVFLCARKYKKSRGIGLAVPEWLGVTAMILAALIAFSRLYVGVHYPTDVLCGSVSGALIGWLVVCFYQKRINKKEFFPVMQKGE